MRTNYTEKNLSDISKSSDFTYDSKNQELLFLDSDLSLKSMRVEENSEGQIINWKEGSLKILHQGLKDCAQLCNKRKNASNSIISEGNLSNSALLDNNNQNRIPIDTLLSQNNIENNLQNQQNLRNNLNLACARLIPYNPQNIGSGLNQQNKLLFSTTGLTVTCMDTSPQTAISTIGFSEGEHFWEFYCPIYCQKIEMGIVAPSIQQSHMIDFNTTTPRQVTFRLNFHTCKLSVYLNGNLHNQKSQTLSILKSQGDKNPSISQANNAKTVWFPAIRMKELGISVIFNPFAFDPENPLSIYISAEQQKAEKFLIDEQTKLELQQRVQQLNQIIKEKLEISKKQQIEGNMQQQKKESKEEGNSDSSYTPQYQINSYMKNNNLLIVEQDKVKLIKKDEQGQYPINCSIFQNKPRDPEDYIDLTINANDTIFLLDNVDWITLIEDNYLGLKDVHSLMELIKISVSQVSLQNKYIQLHLQFQLAKKCVDSIGAFSLQQYKIVYNILHSEKLDQILFNFPPSSSSNLINPPSSTIINSEAQISPLMKISQTFDTIIQQIQIMLCLDEQLFAMTLHYEASTQLAQMFTKSLTRMYSSFSRLGSLMNYTKSQYTPLALSESGLFNSYDTLSSLKHFEHPQIKIDALETMKKKIPLWQNLQLQIPHSRMLKGQTCLNVPLYLTINNIPYQAHVRVREPVTNKINLNDLDQGQIRILRPNRQYASNYVSTVSSDGCVNVWNTEIALLRVFVSDFKRDFIAPKSLKGLLSTNDLKANLKNVESGLFYDLKFPAKTSRKNREQREQEKKLNENNKKKIITSNEIIEQLINMGYSNDIAQKVIANLKNYTLDEAVQEAIRIQILENQGEDTLDSQISLQNIVEDDDFTSQENDLEWICQCTFRNTLQAYQNECEVCQKPRIQKQDSGNLDSNKQKSKESVLDALSKLDSIINQNNKINENQKKQEENQMMLPIQEISTSIVPNTQEIRLQQSEQKSFVRPEWTCSTCEQLVMRSQEVCDKCGTHVPEEFKCTFSEYTALKQAIEKRFKEENEKKQIKRAEDLKNFCLDENSKVQTGIMINCELSKVCPLIVGVGMNSTKKDSEVQSMLRIRRFGFDPNYLNNFYKLSNLTGQVSTPQNGSNIQSSKTIVNQLNGSIITEKTMGSIEDSLFRSENNRQIVECLEPLFMSNQRFSNDSTNHYESFERQQYLPGEKKALFHQEWLELAQYDIVLNEERIIDCVTWCVDQEFQSTQEVNLKKEETNISHHMYGSNTLDQQFDHSLNENVDKLIFNMNQTISSNASPQMMASLRLHGDKLSMDKSQQNEGNSNNNIMRKEWFRVVLLTETMNQSIKVHIYRLEVDNINPYSSDSIQVSVLKEFKVSGPGYSTEKSRLFIPERSQIAFLITGNQIVNIPLNQDAIQGSSIEAKVLKGMPTYARFIGKDKLAILDTQDNLILLSQTRRNSVFSARNSMASLSSIPSTPHQQKIQEKSPQQVQTSISQEEQTFGQILSKTNQQRRQSTFALQPIAEQQSTQFFNADIDIQDAKQLSELKQLLNTYAIGSNVGVVGHGALKSSIYDSTSNLYVKHSFSNFGHVYFTQPTYLSHILITFNFQLSQQQQISTTPSNIFNNNISTDFTSLQNQVNSFSTPLLPIQTSSSPQQIQQLFESVNIANNVNQKSNLRSFNPPSLTQYSSNNQMNFAANFNNSNFIQPDFNYSSNLTRHIELDDPQRYINNLNNKLSKNSFISEETSNPNSQIRNLPLSLVTQKGASQNFQQQESLITCPNTESFVTNYAKSSFTFRHLQEKRMIIESIIVHSIVTSNKGAYPIGSGLIFVADNISFFDMVDSFNGMNLAGYTSWKTQRKYNDTPLQPWEPIGCFEFNNNINFIKQNTNQKEVIKAEMDVKKAGKFIHLLPTNFRSQPDDFTGYFKTGILDIQYFGVQGKILEEDNSYEENYLFQEELANQNYLAEFNSRQEKERFSKTADQIQDVPFLQFQQQQKAESILNQPMQIDDILEQGIVQIEVQVEKDHSWYKLSPFDILILRRARINNPLDQYPIPMLPNSIQLLNQTLENNLSIYPSKSLDLRISPKIFFENKITGIRVSLSENASNIIYQNFFTNKNPQESIVSYTLNDFSIECFQSKENGVSILRKDKLQEYRHMLQDPEKYESLNKNILRDVLLQNASNVIQTETGQQPQKYKRVQALKLLTKLMKVEGRFVYIFYQDLDLQAFIETVILEIGDKNPSCNMQQKSYSEDLKEAFEFLYQFRTIFTFSSDLEKVLINQISTNIFDQSQNVEKKKQKGINQRGLKRFFCLLKWCSNILSQQIFDKLLEILHKVSLQFKQSKNINYYLLRSEHDIADFVFEQNLFSDKFASQYTSQMDLNQNKNNQTNGQLIQGGSILPISLPPTQEPKKVKENISDKMKTYVNLLNSDMIIKEQSMETSSLQYTQMTNSNALNFNEAASSNFLIKLSKQLKEKEKQPSLKLQDQLNEVILANREDSPNEKIITKQQKQYLLKSRIHADVDGSTNKIYTIDLMKYHDIKDIYLSFDKAARSCAVRMKVQVYSINHNHYYENGFEKIMIYSNDYQTCVANQLTVLSHYSEQQSLYFDVSSQNLNCLGFSYFEGISTRYLIIQLTFALVPYASQHTDIEQAARIEVIPEVFGVPSQDQSSNLTPLNYFTQLFEGNRVEELKVIKTMQVSPQLNQFKKVQISFTNFYLDSLNYYDQQIEQITILNSKKSLNLMNASNQGASLVPNMSNSIYFNPQPILNINNSPKNSVKNNQTTSSVKNSFNTTLQGSNPLIPMQHSQTITNSKSSQQSNEGKELEEKLKYASNYFYFPNSSISKKKKDTKNSNNVPNTEQSKMVNSPNFMQFSHMTNLQQPMLYSSSSQIQHPNSGQINVDDDYLDEDDILSMMSQQKKQEKKDENDDLEKDEVKEEIGEEEDYDNSYSSLQSDEFLNDKKSELIKQLKDMQDELSLRLVKYHEKQKQFKFNIEGSSNSLSFNDDPHSFPSFKNFQFQQYQIQAERAKIKQDQLAISQLCNQIRQIQTELLNLPSSELKQKKRQKISKQDNKEGEEYSLDFLASLAYELCSFLKSDEKLVFRLYQKEQKTLNDNTVNNTGLNSVKEEDIKYQNGSPKSSDERRYQEYNWEEDEEEKKQNDQKDSIENSGNESPFLVKLCLDLFEIFIVYENGQLYNEVKLFLQETILKAINRAGTNQILNIIVDKYLIQPFLQKNINQQNVSNNSFISQEMRLNQLKDDLKTNSNLPLYPALKIINQINMFNIVDINSLLQKLKEKQQQAEQALDFNKKINEERMNGLTENKSQQGIKQLQELLLYIWNLTSILKNEYLKIQLRMVFSQQRTQQMSQQQHQLFEKAEEDYNSQESSQGLCVCQNLIGFLLQNSSLISDKDLSSLLSHLFDLILMIIHCVPLNHVAKITTMLFTPNSVESPGLNMKSEENSQGTPLIYSLFFKALSLNHQPLLQALEAFISNIVSPKQLENYSELAICSTQPLTKTQLTEEMDKYLETQLNILFHFQQMIDYMLDYPKNTKGTNPYCIAIQQSNLSITLHPNLWIEHLKYLLQILQNTSKTVVLLQKKNQAPTSKKLSDIQKRKASLSSRKNSLASRKNSSGVDYDSIPNNLIRSKTSPSYNDFQTFNFFSNINSISLEEYIDAATVDKQMLIQTHIVLKLVELLNPYDDKAEQKKYNKEIDEVNEEDYDDVVEVNEDQNEQDLSQYYKFQNSVLVWSLVMSTVSLLKGQIIQESNIFTNLVNQYLLSTEEVRQVHLKNILNLTKIVLNSGFQTKEFCNDLLKIIFKIILKKPQLPQNQQQNNKKDSTNSSQASNDQARLINSSNKSFVDDQELFQLVNGWLEILLTKDTPAPEEFYQAQQQQKEWKHCFCKLNARGAVRLFIGISKFIIRQLNYGGIEGVYMSDEKILAKLQIAEYLLKLLLSAESSYQHLAIIEALCNWHLIESLKSSYSRCIIWYFFNKPDDIVKCVSPASILMKSIGNQVHKLFTLVVEKQTIAEICIELLFKYSIEFSKSLYSNISQGDQQQNYYSLSNPNLQNHYSPLLPYQNQYSSNDINIISASNSTVTTYNALTIASRQSKIFQELLNLWVINDSLAQYMVFKANGFSHLLDIIGINSQNSTQSNLDSRNLTNVASFTDINTSNTPWFGHEDSMMLNQGMLNYLSMVSVGTDRPTIPTQSPFSNPISYNPWNQFITTPNIQQTSKTPSGLQIGTSAFGLNKNFPFTPINPMEKKSVILNESGNTFNSLNSSHIQSQQVLQLASLLAKGTGTSYLEPGGIFGTSEINENTKNSFLKYQVAHPSFHTNLNHTQQNSSALQMSYQYFMNNSNNSNQSQPLNSLPSNKPPSNISYFGAMNINNPGMKSNQSGISPTVINNTIPSLPPLPPMQYNNPQYLFQNGNQVNQITPQIQTSSSSSGNNTINFNPPHPLGQMQFNNYAANPYSDLNDSDIISLANNLQQDYQYIIQQKQKNSELNFPLKVPQATTTNQIQDPLSLLVETECCNQVQLIPLLGQNFQISSGVQDWSYNKKGGKNKIAMHLLTGSQHQELQVLLKLNKVVEMKKLKIGFNCQSTDYSDQKIIGIPSGIIVEGGLSENKLITLGSLQQINDDRYLNYGVKVFVKNFSRIKDETGSIDKCIKSLSAPKVSYIKLRIIRPIITLIEDSSVYINKQFNNIAVSINFLSIIGFNADVQSINVPQSIFKIQTDSAIQIIGKLCAEGMGFDKTIESIANDKQIIQKVKQGFESIEQLIISYEQPLSSFLICIALNNDEFADWIFDYLLDSSKNKIPLAKLLTEIIISQKVHNSDQVSSNKALPRVEKLYEYIVKQIEQYLENNPSEKQIDSDGEGSFTLSNIFPFIDALIAALRVSYPHPKISSNDKDKPYLISIYLKCIAQEAQGFSKLAIKLIVSLLYLPTPFYCDDQENLIQQCLSIVWDRLIQKKQYQLSELMVALTYGGNQYKEWFQLENNKYYKQLLNTLLSEMTQATSTDRTQNSLQQSQNISNSHQKKIKNLFSILCAISSSNEIQNLIIQNSANINQSSSNSTPAYIRLYSHMKHKKSDFLSISQASQSSIPVQNTKLLQNWVDSEFLSQFVDFLKKISHNQKEVIDQIVQGINEDIKELDHKRDPLFVDHLLVPILQSTTTIPICFHAFDTLQRKWLINPIKVLNHPYYQAKFLQTSKNKELNKIDKFTTKLFNQEQKQAFMKTLKKFTLDTGLYKKIKKYDWVNEATQDIDNQASLINKLENKILNNPPYIIVIEGINQGQRCLCGVFSGQAIQKSSIEQNYNIPNGDDCFIFYYSENYQIHFRVEGNEFGQLDVNPETSFLTFKYRELDRIYISFSDSNTSYVDINLFDMKIRHFSNIFFFPSLKPIENSQNIPHDIPNDFSFTKAEYWVLKPQNIELKDEKKYPFKMESMYDIQNTQHHLFQSEYYKQESPYNYYRSPAVYHFPDNLTLRQVILQLNVPGLQVPKEVLQKFKFNFRQTSKILSCDDNITLKSLYQEISNSSNGIIDLEYNVDQFFLQIPQNSQNSMNSPLLYNDSNEACQIIDTFIDQKGFKNIISVIKEQLLNWNNKSRAKKWLIYVQELNLFTVLPNFFNEFMKKKDGVDTLFQLLAGIPDSGNDMIEKFEDPKVSQLKQPLMDGQSDDFPIVKAFKKSQYGQEKSKEDQEKNKFYEEQERKAVQNIYEVLSQVFHQDTQDHKVKNIAIENNLLQTIFERISSASKEKSRKFVDPTITDKIKVDEDHKSKQDSQVLVLGVQKTSQGEKDEKSRSNQQNDQKKKGIGYGSDNTGQNQKWNTNEYVEINKSRNELLLSLMKILENFFKFNNWEIPPKIIHIICESSLLPLLESAFRSGSLLEISKESKLMLQYLKLVEVISENEGLVKCLMKLDTRYQPIQNESIFDLLTTLKTTAEIFLNCLKPTPTMEIQQPYYNKDYLNPISEKDLALEAGTPLQQVQFSLCNQKEIDFKKDTNSQIEQEENNILSQQIASRIIQVHEKVEKAILLYNEHQIELNNKSSSNNTHDQEIDEEQEENKRVQHVLGLPLNQSYRILLEKLRFGYFSMIDRNSNSNQVSQNKLQQIVKAQTDLLQNQYHHHYKVQISQNQSPSQAKMVRLAQEIADMSNSLPVDFTNSVFVRSDSKRVDVMKCIIMGSSGTPYANGAFLYDIFFEDTYPNSSPKVNLQTTGNGKVRFNPNLYNCGKVCLSLLGTWKGQASENWDPKISTLLQVLVSLQAIIMNEDIYFNEPGYEGHSGTEEGEKKNEAYSNIVRYCNIKYAMIDQIRNPAEGFEEVIRRHFYLKREEILKECEGWVERSQKKQANYTGLVHDHNPLICQEFKQANKYNEMITKAVKELREELNKLTPPTSVDTPEEISKKKARRIEQQNRKKHIIQQNKQEKPSIFKKGVAQLHNALNDQDNTQISLAKNLPNMGEEIDINNEEVKDRWSRYICAMGIDAVAKQSKCNIFISGLGPLGIEIAKNIVLSGVKRITLHDTTIVNNRHLSGQFFLNQEQIGKNRAEACLQDIQLLNHYVRVDKNVNELNTNVQTFLEKLHLQDYHVVILAENYSLDILTAVNTFCRERQIKFIATQVQGPFAQLFNDFGENFEVVDKNGEDPVELIISNIEQASNNQQLPEQKKKLKVTLLAGSKHPYEDKDRVIIREVKGMNEVNDESKSINEGIFEIETINTNSFYILTNTNYTPYGGSGVVKNIKTPIYFSFQSLKHCLQTNNTSTFDQNMLTHDFEKLETIPYLHIAFIALQDFVSMNSRYPLPWNKQDALSLIELAKTHFDSFDLPSKLEENTKQKFNQYITQFSFTVSGTFHPLCAFMGGYASQEIIKAITNKYVPTKQFFYADCVEVLPDINWADIDSNVQQIEQLSNLSQEEENVQIKIVLGKEICEKLAHFKLFMVGSGAIGCELLKNFAMLSLCTGEEIPEKNLKQGQLTLTDPDHIETSNLNRQFLFREEHLRKPKSSTAASAAIKMNNKLKGHIVACLDKVCEGTKNIFTDSFFEEQDIVANALDNIVARRYVDMRCVSAKTPLLESGTLGPKGHVQVIIPFKTESYGSQQDPQDEGGDIPHCTLKMFPEETLHCVEWARDKFGKMVTLKPKTVQKVLDEIELIQEGKATTDLKNLRKTLKTLKNRPLSFEDCIESAVLKFYKYFRNNIRQLLHTYPLNQKTKDGSDFWKLPKRAPNEIAQLDQDNPLHLDFITAVSIMKAKSFNIPYPQNFRQQKEKKSIMQLAINIKIPDFSPSEEKSSEIESEVNKNLNGEMVANNQQQQNDSENEQASSNSSINNNNNENNQTILADDENAVYLIKLIIELKKQMQQQTIVQSEEFEKDIDNNGHIDFIYAMANLRSINYSLPPMDWLTVKLKAGKIVPALATTTAAVAGLQTIELVKTIKRIDVSKMKNAFLNLAVPSLQLTEPAPPPTFNITKTLKVNIWDRWELKLNKQDSIQQLFSYFEQEMQLKVFNILIGTELLYAFTMSEDDKQSILENSFADVINNNQNLDNDSKYIDLNILFTEVNSNQILSNTPSVRVYFKPNEDQQQI